MANDYVAPSNPSVHAGSVFEAQEVWQEQFLSQLYRKSKLLKWSRKGTIGTHQGDTCAWFDLEVPKFVDVNPVTELAESVIPDAIKMDETKVTAPFKMYGNYSEVTEKMDLLSIVGANERRAKTWGRYASRQADRLWVVEARTGSNVYYADGVANRGALTSGNVFDFEELLDVKSNLKDAGVEPFEAENGMDLYLVLIDTFTARDVRKTDLYKQQNQFMNADLRAGEIGIFEGCMFVEVDSEIFDKYIDTNVGYCLVLGKDAMGACDLDGTIGEDGGATLVVKTKEDIGGPLEQFGTVGYKMFLTNKLLDNNRIARYEFYRA